MNGAGAISFFSTSLQPYTVAILIPCRPDNPSTFLSKAQSRLTTPSPRLTSVLEHDRNDSAAAEPNIGEKRRKGARSHDQHFGYTDKRAIEYIRVCLASKTAVLRH